MKRISLAITALAMMTVASVASAQATRTWVSGVGDDANPCSRTAPCKTFPGAYSKTAPFGEIDALDPGGFGAVTIGKSLTIDGGGGQNASILVSGTNAILINALSTDVVTIRNITINGINTGLSGIKVMNSLKALHVDNVTVFGFGGSPGRGLDIQATNTAGAPMELSVRNTNLRNNAGIGIFVQPTSAGGVRGDLWNTSVTNNGSHGIFVDNGAQVTIANSNISANGIAGLITDKTTTVSAYGTVFANNVGPGVQSGNSVAGSVVGLSQCNITGNSPGVQITAFGQVTSHQDNAIARNNVDVAGGAIGNAGHQ